MPVLDCLHLKCYIKEKYRYILLNPLYFGGSFSQQLCVMTNSYFVEKELFMVNSGSGKIHLEAIAVIQKIDDGT